MSEHNNTVNQIRIRVFEIIEKSDKTDKAGIFFDWFIISLILLNIVAVILESFNEISIQYSRELNIFETFSVIVFSLEYILRIWVAPYKYSKTKHPYLKYFFSFMAIIDLLAILPFYLPLLFTVNLKYLRILRLFRLLRILKLNRYSDSLTLIGTVIKSEKEKLVMTIFILAVLLLLTSSTMYYIENIAQPEVFTDILTTLWWSVETLTTVGFGDMYPITPIGKLLGGLIAILGIAVVALPSGIITSGLIQAMNKQKKSIILCPHCGKEMIKENDENNNC